MASRKRSRHADDVDGVEVESASSSFRQSSQKRSRVTLAAERGGSVVSDEEDYNVDEFLDNNAQEGPDGSPLYTDDEREEDEVDELLAADIVKRQIRGLRDNIASEEGVIEEVFCRNFMCHAKLRIKLGPLINFIIGHNGSGKSAVLTALQMCLGGKAQATNRGASLRSLIKEGEESATLAVKIKNEGEGAYKPELYGRSITVERHFSRAGTSGFKIRNADDKVITTKKADLDDILDFFAFQLENPINVLTQDMARQFLSNSSPNDKYKFFIRGTQLETLDSDYKMLEEHLDNMEEKLRQREDDITALQQKAQTAKEKKQRIEATSKIQEKMRGIQRMHAWAQVEEQESVLERYQSDVQAAEQRVQEKEQDAEAVDGVYEGQNQAYEAAGRTLADLKENSHPVEENYRIEKEKFDGNKNELLTLQSQQRTIKENMTKHKRDAQRLQGETDQEQQRLSEAEGGVNAERLAELEQLKGLAEEARQAQDEHNNGYENVERARADAAKQLEAVRPAQDQAREAVSSAQSSLRQLSGDEGRTYAPYLNNMEKLVSEINKERRWRSKPVGPMGVHVRLLQPQWSSQLETVFGGALDSFVVTCKQDQDILSQLINRTSCQSTVYIGDSNPLNITGKEPEEGVTTILRALRIDNDLVRNTLIINNAIEQTVLIDDHDEAYKYMYDSGRHPNVKAVISIARGDKSKGTRWELTRSGAQKSGPVFPWLRRPRMKADREEQVRLQRQRVDQAKRDLDMTDQEVRRCNAELTKASQAIARFKKERDNLRIQTQRAEDNAEAKQNEIESNQPQQGKLQELERQLEEARTELREVEDSYQDSVLAKDRLGELGREFKEKLDLVQKELNEAQTRIEKAGKRLLNLEEARTKALYDKNKAHDDIDQAKLHVTRLGEKRATQSAKVEEFIGEAQKISPRVPVEEGATPAVLDERLQKLTEDMRRFEREAGGTREELTAAWKKAELAYREANGQMKNLQNTASVCYFWGDLLNFVVATEN